MQSLKRLFGIFFVILTLSLTSKSQSLQREGPIAEFNMVSYDLGEVLQGKETIAVFTLMNKGNAPLVVENIKVSCGCTLVEWSQDPILPEQSAKITVKYNSNIIGTIKRSIVVHTNDIKQERILLMLTGNVVAINSDY